MDTTFLLKGLAIGFSIAAPVGPLGVLCIRRGFSVTPYTASPWDRILASPERLFT